MRKLVLLVAFCLVAIAPNLSNANGKSTVLKQKKQMASPAAAVIDGVLAGHVIFHDPDFPELAMDIYIYVSVNDPSVVVGIRNGSVHATYYGASGESNGDACGNVTSPYLGSYVVSGGYVV